MNDDCGDPADDPFGLRHCQPAQPADGSGGPVQRRLAPPLYDPRHPQPLSREDADNLIIDAAMSLGLHIFPVRRGAGAVAEIDLAWLKSQIPAPKQPPHDTSEKHTRPWP